MASFSDNILNSIKQGVSASDAGKPLKEGKIGRMLHEFGVELESKDLGHMAKGVLSVIGLAGKSVDSKYGVDGSPARDDKQQK